MPVLVICKCGRDMRLADTYIGKKVRCSVCKSVVLVRPPELDPLGPACLDEEPDLPAPPLTAVEAVVRPREEEAGELPQSRPAVPPADPGALKSTGSGVGALLVIGLLLGVLLLVGGVGVAAYLVLSGQRIETADATPPPPREDSNNKDEANKPETNVKVTRLDALFKLPHKFLVHDSAISPDGKWFTTAGGDVGLMWDATGKEAARLRPDDADIEAKSVAFAPAGKSLAVAFPGGLIRWWDIDAGRFHAMDKDLKDRAEIRRVRYSPDGQLLGVRYGLGFIKLFGAADNSEYAKILEKGQDFLDFAFAGDHQSLVAYSATHLIQYDLPSKKRKRYLQVVASTDPYFTCVACSPTGTQVALGHAGTNAGEYVGILFDLNDGPDKAARQLSRGEAHYFTRTANGWPPAVARLTVRAISWSSCGT
jgi:hypothetical protein